MSFIDCSGRVSIVTGGSRGIGAAAALELARAGSQIAIFDLDGDEASHSAAEIERETGQKARGYAVDVRKSEVLARMCDAVAEDFGGIDHLINNAGVQFVAPLADFPDDKWDLVTSINLDGVFYATKAVWPHLVARKRGRIVNIASTHGLTGIENRSVYGISKAPDVGWSSVRTILFLFASAVALAAFGVGLLAACGSSGTAGTAAALPAKGAALVKPAKPNAAARTAAIANPDVVGKRMFFSLLKSHED